MKKYTKNDFIDYAKGFDYWNQSMMNWSLSRWQDWYGFTHKDLDEGTEIRKNNQKENKE